MSLLSDTQKWFLPLIDVRNTRSPLSCSMIHSGSLSIRLENLFFAFLDRGVTNAVMILVRNSTMNHIFVPFEDRILDNLQKVLSIIDEVIIGVCFNVLLQNCLQCDTIIHSQIVPIRLITKGIDLFLGECCGHSDQPPNI